MASNNQGSDGTRERTVQQGRLHTGDDDGDAGSASWLVRSILMVVGFVALVWGLLSVLSLSVERVATGLTVALLAFTGATVALLLGSFLLGTGLLVHQSGTAALAWTDGIGQRFAPTDATRRKAAAAGVLLLVHGTLALLGISAMLSLMAAGTSIDPGTIRRLTEMAFAAWIIDAVVLAVASGLVASYLLSLRRDLAFSEPLGATGFVVYAIMDAVGVFLFVLVFSVQFRQAGGVLLVAGLLELLVVPIVGIAAFALLVWTGVRMRRLAPGPYPQPRPLVPVYPYLTYPGWTPVLAYPAPAPAPSDPEVPPPPPEPAA